ncbi:hypothetical protein ACN28S_03740 [Cystobacter fuscus]
MTTPPKAPVRAPLVLLAAALTACSWQTRPSPEETTPVARIWRKSAQARDFERFTREGTRLTPEGLLELDPSGPAPADPSRATPCPARTTPCPRAARSWARPAPRCRPYRAASTTWCPRSTCSPRRAPGCG